MFRKARKRKRKPRVEVKRPESPSEVKEAANLNKGSPRFFTPTDGHNPNQQQNVVVNITVNEQEESDIVSCFKACFGCIGTAAKSGAGA